MGAGAAFFAPAQALPTTPLFVHVVISFCILFCAFHAELLCEARLLPPSGRSIHPHPNGPCTTQALGSARRRHQAALPSFTGHRSGSAIPSPGTHAGRPTTRTPYFKGLAELKEFLEFLINIVLSVQRLSEAVGVLVEGANFGNG